MRNYFIYILLFGTAQWMTAQQSFTLDEAIAYALEHNNNIALQSLEIENAEHVIRETKAIGIPKVNGGVEYNYYYYVPKQPIEDFITPAIYGILRQEELINKPIPEARTSEISFVLPHQLTGSISASSLIFDGTYLVGLEASRVYREVARKQVEATKEQIHANVTKAYLNVLITQLNQEVILKNIENVTNSLNEVKAMYNEGFVESLDVDRLQLSLNQLTTQERNLDKLIDLSYNLLKFQMGYPIDEPIQVVQEIDELLVEFEVENLENLAVDPANKAQYGLMEVNQRLNRLNVKRYKKGYLPSVSALASMSYGLQRKNLFDNDETGFLPTGLVGLRVDIPIYDGGDKSAKIQQAKISIERADLEMEEFKRGMYLEVQNAILTIQNARLNLENKKNTLDMTQNIYDKTQIKFTEGVGSSVEVTQAESALYQAQSDYSSALYQLLEAKVDLEIALGTLYENE